MKRLSIAVFIEACFLMMSSIHADHDLATELMTESKLQRIDVAKDSYENNQSKKEDLELEAMLLINSHKVILRCIKEKKHLMLRSIYEKMIINPLFQRPNKDQIKEYREIVKEQIQTVRIDRKTGEELKNFLKNCIKNSVVLAMVVVQSIVLYLYGMQKINVPDVDGKNFLAKYAIDASVIIGVPSAIFLLVKLILELIPYDQVESLQKTNGLLLLFEQLNNSNSQI